MIRVILARNDVLTLFDLRGHITLFFIDLKNNPKHDVGNISSFNHHELTVSYNFVAVIRSTQVKSSCSNVSTRLKFEFSFVLLDQFWPRPNRFHMFKTCQKFGPKIIKVSGMNPQTGNWFAWTNRSVDPWSLVLKIINQRSYHRS